MTEAQLQKKILDYLDAMGCWTCKTITVNKRGVPDILACGPGGQFIAIEVKAPGKLRTVSPLQKHQLSQIEKAGGIAIAADSLEIVATVVDNYVYNK